MPFAQGLAGGVRFVPLAARADAAAGGGLPPGSSTGIDAPLSPRTRVVKEELCLETSPSTLPLEEERQIQGQEIEVTRDEPYVPQEVQLPLDKDGQLGPWCSFHQIGRASCRERV